MNSDSSSQTAVCARVPILTSSSLRLCLTLCVGSKQGVKVHNCKAIAHSDFLNEQCETVGMCLHAQQLVTLQQALRKIRK